MSNPLKTWSSFTKTKDGKELKFRIQEVPEEKYEEVLDFLIIHYAPDEPLHKAAEITRSAASINEYIRLMLAEMLRVKHQIDVCYLDDGSDKLKIAGASIMVLTKRGDPELDLSKFEITTPELKILLTLAKYNMTSYKLFKEYTVDAHFSGRGVAVGSEYRGIGIAGELLKARVEACKEYKVPLTDAWMTAFGSQKAAAKLGWEVVKELEYEEVGKATGIKFADGGPKTLKYMIQRVSVCTNAF